MRDDIVDEILAAEFGDATRTVAFRLLRMAGEGGQVNMTWETFCRACGTQSMATARRHLTEMSKTGLIHFSTNDYVYVTFLAFLRTGSQILRMGSQILRTDAQGDELDVGAEGESFAENANGFANSANGFANSANEGESTSHARGGWLVGSDPLPDRVIEKPTNQPAPAHAQKNGGGGVSLAPGVAELLADPLIGLTGAANLRAAVGLGLEEALTLCVRWRIDFETGRCDGVGALLHRLRHRWKTPALTEMDRAHELYKRHGGEVERARRAKRYRPDEFADVILG